MEDKEKTMNDVPYINGLPLRNMYFLAQPRDAFDALNSRTPGRPQAISTTHQIDAKSELGVAKVIYTECALSYRQVKDALKGTGLGALLVKVDGCPGYHLILGRGMMGNVWSGDRFGGIYDGSGTPLQGTVLWTLESAPNGEPLNILTLPIVAISGLVTQISGTPDELVTKGQAAVEQLKRAQGPLGGACSLPLPKPSANTGVLTPSGR